MNKTSLTLLAVAVCSVVAGVFLLFGSAVALIVFGCLAGAAGVLAVETGGGA